MTIHAEINIFLNLPKKSVKGLDILVIRITKDMALKNSRPCNLCIAKLNELGIRKVFYSNDNGLIVSEIVENMERYHVSSGQRFLQRSKKKVVTKTNFLKKVATKTGCTL